jgi:putative transposase
MLLDAIEAEVEEYIAAHGHLRDEKDRRIVVRNGYQPERGILSPIGPLQVRRPRVDDRRFDEEGNRIRFTSAILPPYLRKTKSLEDLVPWLYLKGISTGAFPEALGSLLGENAPGLSATTVCRLKEQWIEECKTWQESSLAGKRYVYFWVDGIYFNIRLTEDRPCVLVILGATDDGKKELVAIQ